jgi:hypothetical protein
MGQQERSEKCFHSAGIIERNVDGGRSLFLSDPPGKRQLLDTYLLLGSLGSAAF